MSRFRRGRHGIEARLRPGEMAVLAGLLEQLVDVLDDSGDATGDELERIVGAGPRARPDDPVLARLLPDAYADDEEAAGEYRRLTEGDLRAGKVTAARRVLAGLQASGDGHLRLDDEDAEAWLSALNDLRLSLGTRLDVTEDTYAEVERMAPDDPRRPALTAYMWLGWLQETLVQAVAGW